MIENSDFCFDSCSCGTETFYVQDFKDGGRAGFLGRYLITDSLTRVYHIGSKESAEYLFNAPPSFLTIFEKQFKIKNFGCDGNNHPYFDIDYTYNQLTFDRAKESLSVAKKGG